MVEEAAKALGGLDVLVNNAGSLIKRTPFEELSDELIDKVFDLNVRSVIAACQAAVPHMEKAGGGSIINVGSIAGVGGGGPGALGLRRLEGLRPQSDQAPRRPLRGEEHPRQRRRAGRHRHAVPCRDAAGAQGGDAADGPDGAPRRRGGLRRRLPLSSPPTKMSGYVTGQTIHVNGGQLMV